jgi:hypothetical protein
MNMGVAITAGPGMSGPGSAPVGMTAGVHPGTVGSLSQGPGSSIGISSILSGVGMGASTGAGVGGPMPPVGLDFAKVSTLLFWERMSFLDEKMAHIFNFLFSHPFLLHNSSWLYYPARGILPCDPGTSTIHHRCNVSAFY